jgi:hypothetical protein
MTQWPALLLWFALGAAACAQERTARITVHLDKNLGPMEMDRFALGQGGLSDEPMLAGRVAEVRALNPRLIRLFVQEYYDLLPAPGRYHWTTLDAAVDQILATGAKPLMCITFKPRTLFPRIDQDIVEPESYEAWEELVYNLVRRYKERGTGIRYWEVSNEPDIGENGGCPYRFQPDSYTRYYARTVGAILRADPEARVGGPALANLNSPILPALLDFCQREKQPLHFISWHIYSNDPLRIRRTIEQARALLANYPGLKAETVLDEWNMSLSAPVLDPRFQPCFVAEVAWQMREAGLDYSCYYHIRDYHVEPDKFARFMSPAGTALMTRWWNQTSQFCGLFDFQNRVRPAYFTFRLLSRLTGDRLALESSDKFVHGFASHDQSLRRWNLLLWNFSPSAARVQLAVSGVQRKLSGRRLVLDAVHGSDDENDRLRPAGPVALEPGKTSLDLQLEAYGVTFLYFDPAL